MTALVVTFWLAVIGHQGPTRVPACEVYKISAPTVIAFFEYEGCRNRPYCEDALDDFQFYLRGIRARFNESGIPIHECYRESFEVEVRGKRKQFRHDSVGYYLITPGKEPRVEMGVVTEADLVQVMNEYFGPDVVSKAVSEQKSNLPADYGSILHEFAAHDADGKAYVVSKATVATDERSRALARALLSEWDLSLHSERLTHPMPVHAPKLQAGDRRVQLEVFSIRIDVDETGRAASARFSTQPSQVELGGDVLRIVQTWLFRPAFKGGRFVDAKDLELNYTVHVK